MEISFDTLKVSENARRKVIDQKTQKILISKFTGTEQEIDLTEQANCKGFGRIHHFNMVTSKKWLPNPLPNEPACKALHIPIVPLLKAQVFQIAICNWQCWYCFVPRNLCSANPEHSKWLSAADLLDLYELEPDAPRIIDLSGGQPDLVPEWIPWMMSELRSRGLENTTYLWSDDNLSTDHFWHYLNANQIALIKNYKNYGKVGCFKGFDRDSFSFNTNAEKNLFDNQFELIKKFIDLGIDIFAYVTFTTPSIESIIDKLNLFIDKLIKIDANLPLRTIPLEIKEFTPVKSRLDNLRRLALENQYQIIRIWQDELKNRFSKNDLQCSIVDVKFKTNY